MSKTKRNLLLVPLTVLVGGFSLTSTLQLPQAHSQQDYEELIITETNNEQKLNQKNIGSGSSSNLNCGTNVIESTSTSTTCPTIPGETPTPTPGTIVIPVVTQRMAEIPIIPSGTTSGEAECNPDEVVTGGGYEITEVVSSGGGGGGGIIQTFFKTFKEFAVDNSWHIETNANLRGTVQVYAECLKLVPT
jgi:hypothetical protein